MSDKNQQQVDMTYWKLREYFRAAERQGQHLTGYIVFSPASFEQPYPLEVRTYGVSSNNKAFQTNMGGYSIYASSLDGSDPLIRLEQYMATERGGKDGWQVERCYIFERFAAGDSPRQIVASLTRMNVKSPAGKDTWNRETITKILNNEKYVEAPRKVSVMGKYSVRVGVFAIFLNGILCRRNVNCFSVETSSGLTTAVLYYAVKYVPVNGTTLSDLNKLLSLFGSDGAVFVSLGLF